MSRAIQRELVAFYRKMEKRDFSLPEISKSAFSHARGERELALGHLPVLEPGKDLVIMDRGYGGFKFTYELQQRGIDYCIRLRDDWWKEVKQLVEAGQTDQIVTLKREQQFQLFPEMKLFYKELTCRVLILTLPNGQRETLVTSLKDKKQFPYECFCSLYQKRWNIEEGYKLYKSRLQLDVFSGKTVLSVRQDFHGKVFLMTTTAVYAFPVEEQLKKEQLQSGKKHLYKVNRTNALALVKEMAVPIFIKKTPENYSVGSTKS